jgi:hypothetical protein
LLLLAVQLLLLLLLLQQLRVLSHQQHLLLVVIEMEGTLQLPRLPLLLVKSVRQYSPTAAMAQ